MSFIKEQAFTGIRDVTSKSSLASFTVSYRNAKLKKNIRLKNI